MKWLNKLLLFGKKFKQKPKSQKLPVLNNGPYYDKLLNTLKRERSSLSIKFEQSNEPYVSMLLDVDPNRQFIILDEINSPLGHRLACLGEEFVVTAKENGIFIFFHSKVLDYGSIEGITFYRLPFPSHIELLQRRSTQRLKIPADIALTANFLLPHIGVVRAKILDISLSGLQLTLPRNLKSLFDNVNKIDHCRLVSPFLPASEFSLEVKHYHYDVSVQRTFVGCQFANLDNTGLKFLSLLTSHLQLPLAFRDHKN